jgi:hypothetical protein
MLTLQNRDQNIGMTVKRKTAIDPISGQIASSEKKGVSRLSKLSLFSLKKSKAPITIPEFREADETEYAAPKFSFDSTDEITPPVSEYYLDSARPIQRFPENSISDRDTNGSINYEEDEEDIYGTNLVSPNELLSANLSSDSAIADSFRITRRALPPDSPIRKNTWDSGTTSISTGSVDPDVLRSTPFRRFETPAIPTRVPPPPPVQNTAAVRSINSSGIPTMLQDSTGKVSSKSAMQMDPDSDIESFEYADSPIDRRTLPAPPSRPPPKIPQESSSSQKYIPFDEPDDDLPKSLRSYQLDESEAEEESEDEDPTIRRINGGMAMFELRKNDSVRLGKQPDQTLTTLRFTTSLNTEAYKKPEPRVMGIFPPPEAPQVSQTINSSTFTRSSFSSRTSTTAGPSCPLNPPKISTYAKTPTYDYEIQRAMQEERRWAEKQRAQEEQDRLLALELQRMEDEEAQQEQDLEEEARQLREAEEREEADRLEELERIAFEDALFVAGLVRGEQEDYEEQQRLERERREEEARIERERQAEEERRRQAEAARLLAAQRGVGAPIAVRRVQGGTLVQGSLDDLTAEIIPLLKNVRDTFARSLPAYNIVRIEWIMNPILQAQFDQSRTQLRNSGRPSNEILLFHGTAPQNVNLYTPFSLNLTSE